MLKKLKKIDVKLIDGKRIRTYSVFYLFLFLDILALLMPIYGIVQKFDPLTIKGLFIIYLIFSTFCCGFILLDRFVLSRLLCILSEDKLYFFNSTIAELSESSNRKKITTCDGCIDYSDIKDMKFVPPVRGYRTTIRYKYILITGERFQIELTQAPRALISQIRQKQKSIAFSSGSDLPNFDTIKHERSGIWETIWNYFEENKANDFFDPPLHVTYFNNDEDYNAVEIEASLNDCSFIFHIDEEGLIMFLNETEIEEHIPLSSISDVDTLIKTMNKFIIENAH